MIQLDVNKRPDPILSDVEPISSDLLKRVVKVAIPFLCFYQPAAKGVSLVSGALQSYAIINNDHMSGREKAFQVAGLTTTLFLTLYKPGVATLLTQGYTIFSEGQELHTAVKENNRDKVKEKVASLASMALYLTSLYYKKPELIAASLLMQAFNEYKEAYDEYQAGHYIECVAKLILGSIRVRESRFHLSRAYRRHFGRDFTQKEWDQFVEVVESGKYSKKVEGGRIDLSNYLESENYSDIIRDIHFVDAKGRSFDYMTFKHIQFENCQMIRGDFERSTLNDVCFISCDLKQSKFYNAMMDDVRFYNSNLQKAAFYNSQGRDVRFLGCDLSRACFNASLFEQMEIVSSRLFGTSFLEAQIVDSWVRNCDLTDVLFMGASFNFESCSEHWITKPVIALTWDFPEDGSWGAPVEDVIEDHEALCLKFDIYPDDIDTETLKQEVQEKLSRIRDPKLSKAHEILSDRSVTPEISKIQARIQKVMEVANGAILSGGEDVEKEFYSDQLSYWTDYRRSMIEYAVIHTRKPIMGICRGSQIINTYYGGTLKDTDQGWGDPKLEILDTPAGEFVRQNIGEEIYGHSAHHQAAEKVGEGLEVALMHNGVIKGMFNQDRSVILTQFHPEAYIHDKVILQQINEEGELILGELLQYVGYAIEEGEVDISLSGGLFDQEYNLTSEAKQIILSAINQLVQSSLGESSKMSNNRGFFEMFMDSIR